MHECIYDMLDCKLSSVQARIIDAHTHACQTFQRERERSTAQANSVEYSRLEVSFVFAYVCFLIYASVLSLRECSGPYLSVSAPAPLSRGCTLPL
jgi:hypothetical protein